MELRQQHESDCRRTVGLLEQQRAEFVELHTQKTQERLNAAEGLSDPSLHEIFSDFWKRVEHELKAIEKDIATIDARIIKAREALIEAHRESVVIAKLQERDKLAMQRDAERRERRFLDDFAGARHGIALAEAERTMS